MGAVRLAEGLAGTEQRLCGSGVRRHSAETEKGSLPSEEGAPGHRPVRQRRAQGQPLIQRDHSIAPESNSMNVTCRIAKAVGNEMTALCYNCNKEPSREFCARPGYMLKILRGVRRFFLERDCVRSTSRSTMECRAVRGDPC